MFSRGWQRVYLDETIAHIGQLKTQVEELLEYREASKPWLQKLLEEGLIAPDQLAALTPKVRDGILSDCWLHASVCLPLPSSLPTQPSLISSGNRRRRTSFRT